MKHQHTHQPVILLIDGSATADCKFIKAWFQKSRFCTSVATDVFQALEEVSDFTTPRRPDVVLLEVESLQDDFQMVRALFQPPSGKCETQIFALSQSGNVINDQECFEGNLSQLEARLNLIIPQSTVSRQAHAA